MALLHLEVSSTSGGSDTGLIVISSLIFLGMIGTVGFLAWKNRKDQK
ncbi:MAG: hypothetical protein NVV57_05030 [Demequina sp.]|jgi:hypothetical protein|nr:hypothetical protein [Demequina sp.]